MSVIDDVRVNWAAFDESKKRKIIVISVLVTLILAPLLYQLIFSGGNSYSVATEQKSKSVSGVRSLNDTPDVAWLGSVGVSNAAMERKDLRDGLALQEKSLGSFKEETNKGLTGIVSSVDKVSKNIDKLSLELAKESAERKATLGFLAQRLQDVSNGVGFDATDGAGQTEGFGAVDLQDRGLITRPKLSSVKVSPFDMAAISKYSNSSLSRIAQSDMGRSSIGGSGATTNASADDAANAANTPATVRESYESSAGTVKKSRFYNGGDGYTALIPVGSIVRARLVSGMDAMVAGGAADGNQPVIAKITDPLLLPNGRMVDLRGCVIMAGGYGNLSTERVYMNTTLLSCIDADDEVFETTVSANALGSDGKLGVRGVMVTRDGALILRTMQAGLLQGVATAFSDARRSSQPTFSTGDNQFQFPDTSYVAKSSLVEGVNKGLEQLVSRYNNILDQIFPVLQIDAGRIIEFQVMASFEVGKGL